MEVKVLSVYQINLRGKRRGIFGFIQISCLIGFALIGVGSGGHPSMDFLFMVPIFYECEYNNSNN